jgi:ferredoxin
MPEPPARLSVNPIACSGHGLCAELLPELITLDEWGYPLLPDAAVPVRLTRAARRAVTNCPALALRLSAGSRPDGRQRRRGFSEESQLAGPAAAGRLEP